MTFYKIRNAEGLFSSGGSYPKFRKHGKIWKKLGHLKNHINQISRPEVYANCFLVELEYKEVGLRPIDDFVVELKDAKKKKSENYELARQAHLKQGRFEQFQNLKKEFDK